MVSSYSQVLVFRCFGMVYFELSFFSFLFSSFIGSEVGTPSQSIPLLVQ